MRDFLSCRVAAPLSCAFNVQRARGEGTRLTAGSGQHALGAARTGDATRARAEVDTLAQIEAQLADLGGAQAQWSTQVKIQRLAASAWAARAVGESARAMQLAKEAADLEDVTEKHPVTPGPILPARELEGDLLLDLGHPREALAAYEASLVRQPNRGRSLLGAARAAQAAGDRAVARDWYRKLSRLMAPGDGTWPELREARRALGYR